MPETVGRHNGGTRTKRRRTRPMSEINVTPMVDVMLVLLVIFMVTAPLLTVGVEVDLPKVAVPAIKGQDEPLAVTVDRDGRIFVQDTGIELETLVARLEAVSESNRDVRIFVRGDEGINYGRIMQVMGAIHAGGFTKVALITRPLDASPADGERPK